jgi:hypothetical protein
MKRFEADGVPRLIERSIRAAIIAMLCGGCGAAPESTAERATGDLPAETSAELLAPSKGRPPLVYGGNLAPADAQFARAGTGKNFGDLGLPVKALSGRVTVGKPITRKAVNDGTPVHSLAEISAQTMDQLDTVEIGWIVYDDDPNPRLFVFNWVRGGLDAHGNPTTAPVCNPNSSPHYFCSAFKSTHSTIKPDMVLSPGTTVTLGLTHVDSGTTAGWHFLYNGTDFGYLAEIGWGNRFKSVGVAQWFGEVAGTTAVRCSEMGNGKWGTDTTSASFSTIQYTRQGQTPTNATDLDMWFENEPTRYRGVFGGSLWRAPFRFGGPFLSSSSLCVAPTCKKKSCCGGSVMVCETQSCPLVCPPPDSLVSETGARVE